MSLMFLHIDGLDDIDIDVKGILFPRASRRDEQEYEDMDDEEEMKTMKRI